MQSEREGGLETEKVCEWGKSELETERERQGERTGLRSPFLTYGFGEVQELVVL